MKRTLFGIAFASLLQACPAPPPPPARVSAPLPPRPALGSPVDRMGRPLTANALIGPIAKDDSPETKKEAYNRAPPNRWSTFVPDLLEGLRLYDGLDGACGNAWMASAGADRYAKLATLMADDRLWIDTRVTTCTQVFALERGITDDCGGRTPNEDAVDVFRSLLATGATTGIDDGVVKDDRVHSTSAFPFLGAP